MPGPANIRELRYRNGTSLNQAFTAANNGAWDPGTAYKLAVTAFDASGLEYQSQPSPILQQHILAAPANVPTIKAGSVKFSTYLGGGSANTTANAEATLMSLILGGLASPVGSKTATLDNAGTHTAIKLYSTGFGAKVVAGQAVLVGTRGDGRGNGEVRRITGEGTDYIDISPALPAAPADNDVCVISHTAYVDVTTTQQYIDLLAIGFESTDVLNMLGCMGSFGFSGLNVGGGEIPLIDYDLRVAHWREESSGGTVDALTPGTAMVGSSPPVTLGQGAFILSDAGSTTLKKYKIADLGIAPGITYEAVPDLNGINGIGAYGKVQGRATANFSVLIDGSDADILPGLYDDFSASTGKQLIAQFGHVAGKCCAIDMEAFYFDGSPKRAAVGALAALAVTGHADIGASSSTTLTLSPFRAHWF